MIAFVPGIRGVSSVSLCWSSATAAASSLRERRPSPRSAFEYSSLPSFNLPRSGSETAREQEPPVNDEGLTSHVAGCVARQINGHAGDVVRLAHAAHRGGVG